MTRAPVRAAVLLAALAAGCGEGPRRPDVLVISLDTVRADMLTFLDEQAAPNLAALARRGVVFTHAVAGSSWTLPSHAQLFTGQPPVVHGAVDDGLVIDPLAPTLPALFDAAGYATHGFWTGWYLADEYGFARGFDSYENAMDTGRARYEEMQRQLALGDLAAARKAFDTRHAPSHADVTSGRVVELASEALARAAPDEPLLLFCHLFDPHYDYIPPPPYDTLFDPGYDGPIDGRGFMRNKLIWDEEALPRRRISERDLDHVIALYRGEIAWADAAIGSILERLAERGRLDETIIVVTADHGEEFFEHDHRGHRGGLFDEVLRVPLLIVPPRGRAGGRGAGAAGAPGAGAATGEKAGGDGPRLVHDVVGLDDVLPTVLELAGLPVPPGVLGRSLAAALHGAPLPPRPVVSSLVVPGNAARGRPAVVFESLRTADQKLIRRVEIADGRTAAVAGLLHFDLGADPRERRPLLDPARPEVAAAWTALEDRLDELRAAWRRLPRSPIERRLTRIAEAFASDLPALGYAGGGGTADGGAAWMLGPLPRLALPAALAGADAAAAGRRPEPDRRDDG